MNTGSRDNPLPPEGWEDAEMKQVLVDRDISSLYRLLRRAGISQRQIAALTGQSQSEVSEILKGRQVMAYDVLVRISDGLGQMLRQAVWDRLDMLDELASSADNGSLLSVARSELPRLTYGWRALLATHAPDPRGRCPECSSWWRPRASPCSVWRAAHEHLVSAEAVPQVLSAVSSIPAGVS
jgi:transcriptional regulator with XRE-family HTH domain